MKLLLPLVHLDNVVFTPLPQLRLKKAVVDAGLCAPDDVTIYEWPRDMSLQAMLDIIIAEKPDVIGFSAYTWNFLTVERLSEAIQQILPTTLIVWGGPHTSELPRLFFESYPNSVDLIITWYGEGSFPEVIRLWQQHTSLEDIAQAVPGVWSAQHGVQAEHYPPLDTLGNPYVYLPASVTEHMADRVFLLETYRNCPFSCSYCLWGQAAKTLDAITGQQMLDYTYDLVDKGARIFMFADAGLGIVRNEDRTSRDKQIFRKFADDRILQKAGVQMRAYHFWQTMDDEMLDVFQELIGQGVMGQIDIGIQTFNKDVLHDLQRPTNYDKFFRVVQLLHDRDIRFSLDLVLGLPGDTLEGFKDSLRKVISCKPDRTQTFPLSVLPGTAYDLRRDELGIRTVRGSYRDDAETVIATNSFPYEDMLAALDIEAWMYLWYAEQICVKSLTALAEEKGIDPLTLLDSLRQWADGKHLGEMAKLYRQKLYDSRSDGRYAVEQYFMDNFALVFSELHNFFLDNGASVGLLDLMFDEMLQYPKTKDAADGLHGWEGIEYDYTGVLIYNGATYTWHKDPVVGAIGRMKNFYLWRRSETERVEANGTGYALPEGAGAYE